MISKSPCALSLSYAPASGLEPAGSGRVTPAKSNNGGVYVVEPIVTGFLVANTMAGEVAKRVPSVSNCGSDMMLEPSTSQINLLGYVAPFAVSFDKTELRATKELVVDELFLIIS